MLVLSTVSPPAQRAALLRQLSKASDGNLVLRLVSLVQLSEKTETIQKKYKPDLGLNIMCVFEFGYTEFSCR